MTSEALRIGIELIKKFEGCRLTSYRCPAGVWTIGYGHTGPVDGKTISSGMEITQQKADSLLSEDVLIYASEVDKLGWELNDNQAAALLSFCYNCGGGALLSASSQGADKICANMSKYVNGGGKRLEGLVKRRKEECELFNTPASTPVKPLKKRYYPKIALTDIHLDILLFACGAADTPPSIKTDWEDRRAIASANGMPNYTGTFEENVTLKRLISEGKLIKP